MAERLGGGLRELSDEHHDFSLRRYLEASGWYSPVFGFIQNVEDWIRQSWSSDSGQVDSGQVLLFLSQDEPLSRGKKLRVFLQPRSVSVDEVTELYPADVPIRVPASCRLTLKHRYSLECPEAEGIHPAEAEFGWNVGRVQPQFEVRLAAEVKRVKLIIRNQKKQKVWEETVDVEINPMTRGGGRVYYQYARGRARVVGPKPYQSFTSVCVRVLLVLEAPDPHTRCLHVVLLQHDVSLDDAELFGTRPPRDAVLIPSPGTCQLMTRKKYRVDCPEALMITPKEAVFDQNYGEHYSSKFEIVLPEKTSQLTLRIRDQENEKVWEDHVTLPEKWPSSSTDAQAGSSKWEEFTPQASTEWMNECRRTVYRFTCPGSGSFRCTQTGLVFVVDQTVMLEYGTVRWDEFLLQSAGKSPAGPLFHIDCPENAVRQLHLPHCEIKPVSEGLLSVAHVTNDGISFIDPLEITDTHVVINVPHLSAFGVVWGFLREMYKYFRSVSGQVLLFLTPPRKLEVLLLSINVDVNAVKAFVKEDAPNAVYIKVPSQCKLSINHRYAVDCPEARLIQPETEEFDLNFGPNYHTTFEIVLSPNAARITLAVRDEERRIWDREVNLLDESVSCRSSQTSAAVAPSAAHAAAAAPTETPPRTLNVSQEDTSARTSKMKSNTKYSTLTILNDLENSEFEKFKWYLKHEETSISSHDLENAERWDVVDLMFQTRVDSEAVEVTKKILKAINRNDLVQELTDLLENISSSHS